MHQHGIVSQLAPTAFKKSIIIPSLVSGQVLSLDQASHPVYLHRLLGDGALIRMTSDKWYCPFDGTVQKCHYDGYQMLLKSKQGLLLHIAIGKLGLLSHGERFRPAVQEGSAFKAGDLLFECDTMWLKQHNDPVGAITIVNSNKLTAIVCQYKTVMAVQDTLFTLYV